MTLNYTNLFDFKPLPVITPETELWKNGTWKFGALEITPDTAYAPSFVDVILSGNTALTLVNSMADGLNYLKLFGGTELLPETYIDTVTAEGKCEQRNLPSGYTQVAWLESSGTQYIITKAIKANQTVKCKMALNAAIQTGWMGAIDAVNSLVRFGVTNNMIYCQRPSTGAFGIASDTDFHTFIASPTKLYIDNNSDTINVTTDMTTPFALFAQNDGRTSNISAYLSCKISEFEITEGSTLVQRLIPCRRNSDNVLGMYDTVSGNLLTNQGTGSFTAGPDVTPTPDAPMDIVCNNGTIKARMASGLPLGYTRVAYLASSGTQYINTKYEPNASGYKTKLKIRNTDTYQRWTGIIGSFGTSVSNSCKFGFDNYGKFAITAGSDIRSDVNVVTNTDYVVEASIVSGDISIKVDGTTILTSTNTFVAPTDLNLWLFSYNRNGGMHPNESFMGYIYYAEIYDNNGVLVRNYIPCRRNSDNVLGMYDLVTNTFETNSGSGTFTAGSVDDSVITYTDGTVETVTDSNGLTATCQNLLSVGNYKDTQEILSGAVTRNIAIKVFDGTEDWVLSTASGTSSLFYCTQTNMDYTSTSAAICTHYIGELPSIAGSGQANQSVKAGYNGSAVTYTRLYLRDTSFSTVSDLTTFLATQYANGTPVIIVYPTSSSTSETVSGQVLNKTPLTYAGSVSGLTGTVVTSSHTTPTPTQPLQINCNNGVVKVNTEASGQNVIDTSDIVNGYISNSTTEGVVVINNSTASQVIKKAIYCEAGKKYKFSYISALAGGRISAIADENNIVKQLFSNSCAVGLNKYTYTANVSGWLWLTVQSGDLATVQPSIYELGNVYTDGTTETVAVHGKNLYNPATSEVGYTLTDTGIQTTGAVGLVSAYIPVKPSTTYTLKFTRTAQEIYTRVCSYSNASESDFLSLLAKSMVTSAGDVLKTFTTDATAKYIRVSFKADSTNVMLEQGSTATTYESYYSGGTATATDLLAVGTYKDVQSVLDGAVTRNVGIKVLDGSENISVRSEANKIFLFTYIAPNGANGKIICSHFFGGTSNNLDSISVNEISALNTSTSGRFTVRFADISTVEGVRQFLSDQYNSGNPVIVIYPLATATTETVTAQSLTTQQGTNIVEITEASMSNLPLEVSYKAGVTVTVTEVENAQLSNSVEVTIQ